MNKINDLRIDTSEMPTAETSRSFTVNGDIGAKFILHIVQDGTLKFYNFIEKTFALGHNNKENNLEVTMTSKRYNGNILFPSGGGSYTITLITKDSTILTTDVYTNESDINENNDTTAVADFKSRIFSRNISKQASNSTITFKAVTTNTNNYGTFPTTTTVGGLSDSDKTSFNWNITNATTDAGGFGLRLTSSVQSVGEKFWYFTTTETVDGAVSLSDGNLGFIVKVDDVTDIGVGSIVSAVSSGSLVGTPTIVAIDVNSKTLTLSGAQTFADGITLTFVARGTKNMFHAIGSNISFPTFATVNASTLTQSVRANVSSSTTVTLKDTQGIAGGDLVQYTGLGVNNTSSNLITSVTPDPGGGDEDGSMVVELAQILTAGTVLSFKGSHKTINFSGDILVEGYPSANKTIFLDLDLLITVGAAS